MPITCTAAPLEPLPPPDELPEELPEEPLEELLEPPPELLLEELPEELPEELLEVPPEELLPEALPDELLELPPELLEEPPGEPLEEPPDDAAPEELLPELPPDEPPVPPDDELPPPLELELDELLPLLALLPVSLFPPQAASVAATSRGRKNRIRRQAGLTGGLSRVFISSAIKFSEILSSSNARPRRAFNARKQTSRHVPASRCIRSAAW